MKKQLLLITITAVLFTFGLTSCTEDGSVIPDLGDSPSIRLVDAPGYISASTTVEVGELLNFQINTMAGDDPLTQLTIKENDQNVALNRITFQSGSSFGSNPALIIGNSLQQGFTEDIVIVAPNSPGEYTYTFEVMDDAGIDANTGVTITVEVTPPTLNILSPEFPFEAGTGTINTIEIEAMKVGADLTSISVYENDVLMDASRLFFDDNGRTAFTNNPEAVPDTDSFQTGIAIQVSNTPDTTNGYTYRIDVTDADGISGSAILNIFVTETLDTTYTGVLVYNKDGQELGGLNLYTGNSVAFNSPDAQIRDLGIDTDKVAAENWIQKIRAVNGAVLKVPGDNQPEGFSFENTNSRSTLIAAYDNGVEIGDSDEVMIDDVFMVQNGNDYFIMRVTDVVVTTSDNNDYYEFIIKKSER
ncbi:MAG TPA: hypothetical protein VJ953_10800 [Saprospiraceae bacterium]|nr:hypothetical protein [Saprospiraceae bacterium]